LLTSASDVAYGDVTAVDARRQAGLLFRMGFYASGNAFRGATAETQRGTIMADEKILIVWENIPDDTLLYAVDANGDVGKLAVTCANKFGNSDGNTEDDDANILNLCGMLAEIEHYGIEKVIEGPFARVVVCGWII
jgi:hypothetical protein